MNDARSYRTRSPQSFLTSIAIWLRETLNLEAELRRELAALNGHTPRPMPPLLFAKHHEAHARSAFFASDFERARFLEPSSVDSIAREQKYGAP